MLRPATPLSVLLGVAFALLLLSVLSTPIIQAIPLGEFEDATFGVFGFCQKGSCSDIGIGYNIGDLFKDKSQAFDLPPGTRNTLSAILVVHPVAAFLTLVMFVMAVTSHFHAPSHSARYLLILFIFTFIDFLVCLLAFLMDVLVFIPHLAWGSYIVLAATILVALSGLVSCAMRRTLVSRKSRKKRIAENAEMSGENFYNREGQKSPGVSTQPTVPMVSGGIGGNADNLPTFASFENRAKDDAVSDERIPLTQRSPSDRSPNHIASDLAIAGDPSAMRNDPRRTPSRDRYGNPLNGPPDGYGVGRTPSFDRMNARGRGDMGPQGGYRGRGGGYGRGGFDAYGAPVRGRGGYGPQGRGGYGPRGGRGGYGPPPPRGAYGPGGMRGGRSPPPGYNQPGSYDRRPSPGDPYYSHGRRSSDPAYNSNFSSNPALPNNNNSYDAYNPDSNSLPRAESPPPLPGTVPATGSNPAIEMDGTPVEPSREHGQYGQLRDSDADVAGMVNLQQGGNPPQHDTYMSDGSKYSNDEQYVPPRAAWNNGSGRSSPLAVTPLNVPPKSPAQKGNYYEDVDPQFADLQAPNTNLAPTEPNYEDIHGNNGGGSRSPAGSERSNFTSISQRGVNPRWNPNPNPPPMPQAPPSRRPVQQRQDMILDNPDFQIPGGRHGTPQRGNAGLTPGSAYPTGPL